jgi:hypothetical protein
MKWYVAIPIVTVLGIIHVASMRELGCARGFSVPDFLAFASVFFVGFLARGWADKDAKRVPGSEGTSG